MWRGATVSRHELEGLRSVENVVRAGKLRRLGADAMTFEHDEVTSGRNDLYVDCTAAGLRVITPRPIFEPNRINVQFVTVGNACWSAAILGAIEASGREDAEKNRLAPVVAFSGRIEDILRLADAGMSGLAARSMDPELAAWGATCRLDSTFAARAKADDPDVAVQMQRMSAHLGAAFENLAAWA